MVGTKQTMVQQKTPPEEISYIQDESFEDGSLHSVSEQSITSSISDDSRGLWQSLQRQLLLDIDEKGGLFSFKLSALCNKKSDIYGAAGTALRRSVQNRVTYWKGLKPEKFEEIKRHLFAGSYSANVSTARLPVSSPRLFSPSSLKKKTLSPDSKTKSAKSPPFFNHKKATLPASKRTSETMDLGTIDGTFSDFVALVLRP